MPNEVPYPGDRPIDQPHFNVAVILGTSSLLWALIGAGVLLLA